VRISAYLLPAVARFNSVMATAAPEVSSLVRDRAFESLYRCYVKDVYHYALALLRNPADAEDVTQTTFMNAYRAFKRGEQIEKPQNWLIKIAHNAARTRYARAARRVSEVPLEDHLDQLAVPESERPDVQAVLDALGTLPLNQRAALVMRELEGRTYAEIADTLEVSVAAVETLIFRARRSLRVKASAIRVLGVVPLPGSLSQLLGAGGSVAAGGGAIVGSGFVLKAAVAIVAGVVATGINSDRPSGAEAAAKPAVAHASVASSGSARVVRDAPVRHVRVIVRRGWHVRGAPGEGGASVPRRLRTDDNGTIAAPPSVVTSAEASRPDSSTPARTSTSQPAQTAAQHATGTVQAATDTVQSATAPVQNAAGTVGSATGALPVQAPVPVAVPSLPPAPHLPAPPPLPSLP
jgi:RNA polymerase sigma factor (sigma-70 family)